MKSYKLMIIVACAVIFGGCAATVPRELVSARKAYHRASTGEAAQVAPAEVHLANQALARAEQSFKENPESYRTRDLAYVAERKSQVAEATASIAIEKTRQALAKDDYQATQAEIIAKAKKSLEAQRAANAKTTQSLNKTNAALAASEYSGVLTAEQLAEEKKARVAADLRTAEALAALAELAAVKDEPRGMVITLSGSVLFASDKATLLPAARDRLDKVAAVLLTNPDRNLVIEGHTDSQGSDSHNLDLSQRRADAVRSYLVTREYRSGLIESNGLGEGHPVADNKSAEGRANNRRVEIIIQREARKVSAL